MAKIRITFMEGLETIEKYYGIKRKVLACCKC